MMKIEEILRVCAPMVVGGLGMEVTDEAKRGAYRAQREPSHMPPIKLNCENQISILIEEHLEHRGIFSTYPLLD